MSATERATRPSVLVWLGLFAAPAAWAGQHVAGIGLTISDCHDNAAGPSWNVPVDTSVIVVTAVAALVAVVGIASAFATYRSASDADDDDAPPMGRNHFLSIIGLTTSPLLLAIILMSGLGSIFLQECVQS